MMAAGERRAEGRGPRADRRIGAGVLAAAAALAGLTVMGAGPGAAATRGGSQYPGVGTEAALENPNCDPETGRVMLPILGGRALPPCVVSFPDGADNGGATSQGVTDDSIKIVFRHSATTEADEDASFERMARDAFQMQDRLETWGRDYELAFVKGSANDEAGQRADATAIALEHEPFAVISHSATGVLPVFEAELAARDIVVFGWVSLWADLQSKPGYRYALSMDDRVRAMHIAEYVGKRLNRQKAEWAGDKELKSQTRKFALVYPEGANLDIDFLESQLSKNGVQVAEVQAYPIESEAQLNHANIAVARMKGQGITTVISLMEFIYGIAITDEATTQKWFPEWFVTGFANLDTAVLSREMDQEQWKHAFGIGTVAAQLQDVPSTHAVLYEWYFGHEAENVAALGSVNTPLQYLLAGVHLAGPNLTPKTLRRALFSLPPTAGAWDDYVATNGHSYGKHLKVPWTDFSGEDDMAEKWWDPKAESISEVGTSGAGTWMKVDGGKYHELGEWPKGKPAMFVRRGTIANFATVDDLPPDERLPDYPSPQGT